MSTETKEFGKWRSYLWPVHGHELKKLLPMFFMFFFISFNYTILRDTKDTLVVTGAAGAEAIPFLKFWGVVPAAILFMVVYAKLSNILSKPALFYTTVTPFLIFFASYALIIHPNIAALQPVAFANYLTGVLPDGFNGMVASILEWPNSLFYILSELWGSVVLSLLFWGFANDITKVTEAKRFYSLFGLGANVALMVSGPTIIYFSNVSSLPQFAGNKALAWTYTVNWLMGLVVLAGLATMAIYWWINKNVLTDPRFYDISEIKGKKSKPKLSIGESFKYIFSSKYLLCIAMLVIGYGISINLVEVTWKGQLKLQYPDANEYSAFMGAFSTWTGFITILMMLFVGSNVIRNFGWGTAAMVTPVVLLITGAAFFAFILFRDSLAPMIVALGTTPLYLAVVFGMMQNIMSKSSKYSLFDPTKEMAYIPLDQEQKVKGKAAVDVVGARLGKSGGSLVQQGLIIGLGGLGAITPYIAAILFVVIGGWMLAARSLSKQFAEITDGPVAEKKSGPALAKATPAA